MRLSVTTVEAYRLWLSGDWMDLEALESQIRGDSPPTEPMMRGRAFHEVLEHPEATFVQDSEGGHYESGDYCFSGEGMDRVLALLPAERVNEAKATAEIGGLTLVGKADALHGLDVFEGKLTSRIDVERYFDSFQWRAYLKLFNAQRVHYILAQGKDGGGHIHVFNVLTMPLYRYPKLDDDVRRMAEECAEFIVQRGLDEYVQDKAA